MQKLKAGSFEAVAGKHYGTPKEVWGFRRKGKGGPKRIAGQFLRLHADLFGLSPRLADLEHQKTIPSLGAYHVIFQQRHLGRRVHRAYVTVHVARDGSVYLSKNRATPAVKLPSVPEFLLNEKALVSRARKALPKKSRKSALQTVEEMWFPVDGKIAPSARVRLARKNPREEWIVYIHAKTGATLSKYDNLAKARGRALVFDPSPVTALGGHEDLVTPLGNPRRPPLHAYKTVSLYGLNANGHLEGSRVTTSPTADKHRIKKHDRRFLLRSHQRGFEEVSVYHHIDSALRYLRRLGFTGAKSIFDGPVAVNVNGTREDNSWYSPWEKMLTFGTGSVDDAEDGETILHELGHAIQDQIIPDFGQSEEAAAMGEGFGDYFAASYFADSKPADYQTSVMTWDGLFIGLDYGVYPPALRYLDWDWTYSDFEVGGSEHDNGEIWSAVLWDVRGVLGAEMADRLIVESHFQLDGFTTFARGARAILDADRNINGGANVDELVDVFHDREIAPV